MATSNFGPPLDQSNFVINGGGLRSGLEALLRLLASGPWSYCVKCKLVGYSAKRSHQVKRLELCRSFRLNPVLFTAGGDRRHGAEPPFPDQAGPSDATK
jgi:hypothetical protein